MSGPERRSQVLGIAAGEFAKHGLYGASIEAVAHEAGITQAYVFRMFETKKAMFQELNVAALDVDQLDEPWANGAYATGSRGQIVCQSTPSGGGRPRLDAAHDRSIAANRRSTFASHGGNVRSSRMRRTSEAHWAADQVPPAGITS